MRCIISWFLRNTHFNQLSEPCGVHSRPFFSSVTMSCFEAPVSSFVRPCSRTGILHIFSCSSMQQHGRHQCLTCRSNDVSSFPSSALSEKASLNRHHLAHAASKQSNPNPLSQQWLHTQVGVSQPMQPLAPVPRGMAFAFSLSLRHLNQRHPPSSLSPISEHIPSIRLLTSFTISRAKQNKNRFSPSFLLGRRRRQHIIIMFTISPSLLSLSPSSAL
ncbi:hypothetical protein M440DRAFT_276009 [Trichoderma longibrachiatum ATCC 18648]|uniref:Uncharacterized protein n=1 Tax=Trichoderma longibrachiatum ATCC 18648 TaxID=983965 RepID=A0A2T4C6S7_TRILO|nr:hypothetical protein M440DRAFT_276009 [Trichoderma longibrachiatum ATCC 18648]